MSEVAVEGRRQAVLGKATAGGAEAGQWCGCAARVPARRRDRVQQEAFDLRRNLAQEPGPVALLGVGRAIGRPSSRSSKKARNNGGALAVAREPAEAYARDARAPSAGALPGDALPAILDDALGTALARSAPRHPSTRYASLPGRLPGRRRGRRGMHADACCIPRCSGKPYRTGVCATCAFFQTRLQKVGSACDRRVEARENMYAAETLIGRGLSRHERTAKSKCAGNRYRTGVFATCDLSATESLMGPAFARCDPD